MKLSDYLKLKNLTCADFGAMVGHNASQVSRWQRGETRPSWDAMAKIEKVTKGAVTYTDFAPQKKGKAA